MNMFLLGANASNYNPGLIDGLLGRLFELIFNTVESLGIGSQHISAYAYTLIIIGIIYKLLTIPYTIQMAKNSARQAEMQPKLDEIKRKYGYDQQIYQQKMMEFQKENKMMAGMGSGCLIFIVQMIIVLALYRVINNAEFFLGAERFAEINKSFFWIPNLSQPDPTGFALPLINSLSQLGYQWLNNKNMAAMNPQASSMNTMMYIMPIMFFFVFRNFAAGLVLYWSVGNVLEIIIRGGAKLFGLAKRKDKIER